MSRTRSGPQRPENPSPDYSQKKGNRFISKISQIYGFISGLKNYPEKIQPRLFCYQRKLADFIKRHRTIKLIHLLRNYSALAVVVSCVFLVAATNAASGKIGSGLLLGYFEDEPEFSETPVGQNEKADKESLAYVPLSRAKNVIDPEIKDEEPVLAAAGDEFLAAGATSALKDPEEGGGVKMYTVKQGDTLSGIAAKNNITVNTILWANDIENLDEIMPGDKLFILPVAGLKHIAASGDTIDSIAKKYKAERDKIIAFNDLPADGAIEAGKELIIPGGEKEVPVPAAVTDPYRRQYATPQGGAPTVSGWRKLEGKAGTGHKFPYGYCTWYVSQRRYVPWRGNAGAWLYNAKAMGYYTGKTPKTGSIIVTTESWWGHVGIVEKVSGGSVTISEMNYDRWGKVNKRTLSTSSRVIKGYIY